MAFATAAATTTFSKAAASIAKAYAENNFGDGLVLQKKFSVLQGQKCFNKNLILGI